GCIAVRELFVAHDAQRVASVGSLVPASTALQLLLKRKEADRLLQMNCVIASRDLQSKSFLRPIKPEGLRILSLCVRKRQVGERFQEFNRRATRGLCRGTQRRLFLF